MYSLHLNRNREVNIMQTETRQLKSYEVSF